MERKQWNELLDKYVLTGHLLSEEYEQLNEIQVAIIQELKKCYKRINKPEILTTHHSLEDAIRKDYVFNQINNQNEIN